MAIILTSLVLAAQIYNGLLFPAMGRIAADMTARGQRVQVLYHDQETTAVCPRYILGHSMGGPAALVQAAGCKAKGHPPVAVVTIDPTGQVGATYYCPRGVYCLNFYDPTHAIGGGARAVVGANNVKMHGYSHMQLPYAPGVVKGALAATAR
jgi:hypothetical protein